MKKALPGIYINNPDKKIDNNKKIHLIKEDTTINSEENKIIDTNQKNIDKYFRPIPIKKTEETLIKPNIIDINKKINNVFNHYRFVYKAKCMITYSDKVLEKTIISKKDDYLITLDNEKININDIYDIKIL